MTVLSVAICNKNAKIILARQFVKMSRMELEENIVNFSRNVDICKDTTHFETDKVRYLFVPFENLYLLVVTTKESNVVEDIEIIKLIYRLLQDTCLTITEETIKQNAVSLVLCIDDIISLGLREGVNLAQVKTFLQMESQYEKEFKREQEQIMMKQKKELDQRGRELDKLKRDRKDNVNTVSSVSSMGMESPIIHQKKSEVINIGSSSVIDEDINQNNKTANKKKQAKGMRLTKNRKHSNDDNEDQS